MWITPDQLAPASRVQCGPERRCARFHSSETRRSLGPMTNPIDEALSQYKADDYTVKLCNVIFGAIPLAPRQASYNNLEEAVRTLYPAATPQVAQRAYQLAGGDGVSSALWMAGALDTGDTGIAIYSGVKSAIGYFFGDKKQAFETDTQQGVDSAVKFLGISYLIAKLFPGSVGERVSAYHTCPAGQAMSFYFAAIDVALPFADNLVSGGTDFVKKLLDKYGSSAADKLGAAGPTAAADAQGATSALLGPVEGIVSQVGPHAKTIALTIQKYLPTAANATDKVAGAVATAADALPVYRYLGARIAAEACVLQASRGQ
jgi:hypothetical protein